MFNLSIIYKKYICSKIKKTVEGYFTLIHMPILYMSAFTNLLSQFTHFKWANPYPPLINYVWEWDVHAYVFLGNRFDIIYKVEHLIFFETPIFFLKH